MQYFGGKMRIAKQISEVLYKYKKEDMKFVEPFCGGLNITQYMSGDILANDKNIELIELYNAILLNNYIPPDNVSKEEYEKAKNSNDLKYKAFVGIGCSFSGKWFGGYARDNSGRNYAKNAKNSLLKKFDKLKKQNITFTSKDYKELIFENSLVYCDPPYNNTTNYRFGSFDSDEFFDWCRKISKNSNVVIISEYSAPSDFKCIMEINTKTDIRNKNNEKDNRIEKLFTYEI